MAETHSEGGGEGGVGPSYSKPDGDLLNKMAQMLADHLKDNVHGLQNNVNRLQGEMNGGGVRDSHANPPQHLV
ncbi:hypothetical protein AAHA92_32839 [Salvia divinorum]|uniref:Uncharacterized protein n=1 Tax=Salvia divinorum TaxID=28513 RepID=A0ABD1FM24_SALDI